VNAVVVGEGPGFRIERSAFGDTLVVTDKFTAEASSVLYSGSVAGLDLNYALGFKNTDLEFIEPWPITRIRLLARTIKSIEPIYRLPSLASLSLGAGHDLTLDLRRTPQLATLGADWIAVCDSISECTELEDLYLGGFNEADLSLLRWNSRLRRLRMKDRPQLRTLDGLVAFPLLEALGIFGAPLRDISALRDLSPNRLTELELESCRIGDVEALSSAVNLRILNLSEIGDIPSLRALAGMRALEFLWMWGSTRIIDADLSVLARLPLRELRMQPRRTYQPSVQALQDGIEQLLGK
jgi:hypothetical protein